MIQVSDELYLFKLIYSDGNQSPFRDTLEGAKHCALEQSRRDPGIKLCQITDKAGGQIVDFHS